MTKSKNWDKNYPKDKQLMALMTKFGALGKKSGNGKKGGVGKSSPSPNKTSSSPSIQNK